jgi:hypothetical protein
MVTDVPNMDVINNKYGTRWFHAQVKNFPIHSVKRLSDNEVFTVGDEIDMYGKIRSITFDEKYPLPHDISFHFDDNGIAFLKYVVKKRPQSNDSFTWDDKLVWEFGVWYREHAEAALSDSIESFKSFKQSKQPLKPDTKERIEVMAWNVHDERNQYGNTYHYAVPLGYEIPKEKFPLIKQAIERVLNDDVKRGKDFYVEIPPGETILTMFTKEQMDKAISDAFEAGRHPSGRPYYFLYPTITDYLNHLKK